MSWNSSSFNGASHASQPRSHIPSTSALNFPQPFNHTSHSTHGQQQPQFAQLTTSPFIRPLDIRAPRRKGNPVITRYAPPPGYRGPAQPPTFLRQQSSSQAWPHQHGYSQVSPIQQTFSFHGYPTPLSSPGITSPTYNQHHFPNLVSPTGFQNQAYQWSRSSSFSHQRSVHTSGQHSRAGSLTSQNGVYPLPSPNSGAHGQSSGCDVRHGRLLQNSTSLFGSSSGPHSQSQAMPGADSDMTPTPARSSLATSHLPGPSNAITPADGSQLFLGWDDWDFDYDGAIWPKSNESVDLSLSLGVIIWHPAEQVSRALPSSFAQAETQAESSVMEGSSENLSASIYCTEKNYHEIFLDVRQTADWRLIKDDPIFVIFNDQEMQQNMVTLDDCIAQQYRNDRLVRTTQDEDQEMRDASWDIMNHLEQALSDDQENSKATPGDDGFSGLCTQAQEDILASLGVTGTPKPPSNLAVPTRFPSFSSGAPAMPRTLAALSVGPDPPLPQPLDSSMPDAFEPVQHNEQGHGAGNLKSMESTIYTMKGALATTEITINDGSHDLLGKPALLRRDSSKKRSFDDTDQEIEAMHRKDDQTKRKRCSQVKSAYR